MSDALLENVSALVGEMQDREGDSAGEARETTSETSAAKRPSEGKQ